MDTFEITDDQLDELWREAMQAGDYAQADLCRLAQDGDERARQHCADVVSYAERERAYQDELARKAER